MTRKVLLVVVVFGMLLALAVFASQVTGGTEVLADCYGCPF